MKTRCMISDAWEPGSDEPHPPMLEFTALWDTGATGGVISQTVVDACELQATGTRTMHHAQGSTRGVSAYTINIELPNDLEFQALPVILGDLPGYDVLIGMDIIGLGDFAITHPEGDTKFSFRIPSQADIDFARDDNRETSRRSRRS